jgi:hypothetical protein
MTLNAFMRSTAVVVLSVVMVMAESHTKSYQYVAPDGGARVVIFPIGKKVGRSDYESRIEFRSADNNILCGLDYSSTDSEHGFGVVRVRWTPDSQYFVFSLASSGGHQAWHAPTQFFSRGERAIRTLDDYFESEISNPYFRVRAPNTVKTAVAGQNGEDVAVSIKLDALPPTRSWRTQPFSATCKDGLLINVDEP